MKEWSSKINENLINGSDLAYLGDAYYELCIRTYLLALGITKPDELHKQAEKYVSSSAHAQIIDRLLPDLIPTELDVYHRGRNYNYRHKPKNADSSAYIKSSGFEALIGYLYLTEQSDRLQEIITAAVRIIGEKQ